MQDMKGKGCRQRRGARERVRPRTPPRGPSGRGGKTYFHGTTNGSAGIALAKLVEAVKNGAVLSHVVPLELPEVLVLVVRRDQPEELDVLVRVEPRELVVPGRRRAVDLKVLVQPVVQQQVVRHSNTVGLHGMGLAIVVVPDLRVVEVSDLQARGRRREKE